MQEKLAPGGTFTMAAELTVSRMGYGATQLAAPHASRPPADRNAAIAVLRDAVALGVMHIDTSDYYGPHVTNGIIKEALYRIPPTCTSLRRLVHGSMNVAVGRPH